jgi:tripartite-type tricarboxylate transporter receptor subunit TctC
MCSKWRSAGGSTGWIGFHREPAVRRAYHRLTVVYALLVLAPLSIHATQWLHAAEQPFYAGKTIRIISGFAAGGTIDLSARLFARYLPKYISGNPTVIVQTMTGAGGQVAANYTYGVAKPDGLTLLQSPTGPIMNAFLAPESVQYEVRRVAVLWVSADSWVTVINPKAAQVKKAEDLLRTTVPLRAGGSGLSSLRTLRPKLALEAFGVEHTLVTGYQGSSDLLLALEKGEIHLFEDPQDGYKTNIQPREKQGTVAVLWQTGILTSDEVFKRSDLLPQVPTLGEILPKEKKKGPAWIAWKAAVVPQAFQYLMTTTPGVPADRMAILNRALEQLPQDAAFRKEFENTLGEPPDLLIGDQADRVIKESLKRLFEDYQVGVDYLRALANKK